LMLAKHAAAFVGRGFPRHVGAAVASQWGSTPAGPGVSDASGAQAAQRREASGLALTSQKLGNGGRHSISGITATIFGSTGFLGRYVVSELGKMGSRVVLPLRCNENNFQHLKVMGDLGQVNILQDFNIKDEDKIRAAIAGSNLVINLIGREYETSNFGFEEVQVSAAEKIARVSAELGVERLIHVSALGAEASNPSKFLQTKAAGEAAVKAAFPSATIVQPAAMAGTEDRLLAEFARWSKKLPFVPIFDGGETKFQPVHVHDVALAIREMALVKETAGATFKLAGPEVMTWDEMVQLVFSVLREQPRTLPLPLSVGKLAAKPLDWFIPRAPFPIVSFPMLTTDFLASLERDYVVPPAANGFQHLGLEPRKLESLQIDYLRSFRAGGYDHGSNAGQMY